MISFDSLLKKVGEVGISQVVVALLLGYTFTISGYHSLATVFIAYEPQYRCNVPPLDNSTAYPNLTESDILNYTTPYDPTTGEYDTCSKYGYDYNKCDGTLSCVNKSAKHITCDKGYWYDKSLFTETVVTEFDLICDRSYLIPLSTSMYYVGMLIGSFLFGNVADRYGRKPTMIVSAILATASMFALSYSTSVAMYTIFRACIACFNYGGIIGTFVYIIEIVGPKWRTPFGLSTQIVLPMGFLILSGMAYEWRDWHNLMLAVSIASSPLLIFVVILPESPRWLFAMKRDEEGIRVTKLMARINRKELSEEDLDEARKAGEETMKETSRRKQTSKHSYLDLFRTRGLRLTSLNIMFNWFVNSLVYYGVSLNAGSLAGDIFVNNILNTVFEIAATVVCILFLDRIGRRILIAGMFIVAGVGLIASVIVNEYAGDNQDLVTLGVVFAFIGKFGISGSFTIIYNFTAELYPTVLRSNGVGNGSIASRIGGISAPYIISLQSQVSWLPNSLFGVMAVAAGLLSLKFPETNGKPMMETIEQAEIFYKTGEVVDLNKLDDDTIVTDEVFINPALSTRVNESFEQDETSPLLPQ